MILCVVRAGVPGPQHPSEHLPSAGHEQRVETEAALVVPGRQLLLGMHTDGGRVEVEDHTLRRATRLPSPGTRERTDLTDPVDLRPVRSRAAPAWLSPPRRGSRTARAAPRAPPDPTRNARRQRPSPPDHREPGPDHARSAAHECPPTPDKPSVSPSRCAVNASSAVPARDDKPMPSATTSSVPNVAFPITFKVNLLSGWIAGFDNRNPPRPGGRFSPPATPPPAPLLTNAG